MNLELEIDADEAQEDIERWGKAIGAMPPEEDRPEYKSREELRLLFRVGASKMRQMIASAIAEGRIERRRVLRDGRVVVVYAIKEER